MEATGFDHLKGDADTLSQRLSRSLGSPFGAWSDPVNQPVAIAMLTVYGIIFLAGLIGHVCVVAYTISSRKSYSTTRRGALLILANLSTSHLLFLLGCLPSIAYKSVMNLSYGPWILGDVVCRVVPFLELFTLGVTVLSFCVLGVDRLISSGKCKKAYEEAGDSCLTGVCKIVVIWLGALLLASPEIFVFHTTLYQEKIPQTIFESIVAKDPQLLDNVMPDYTRLVDPEKNWQSLSAFFRKIGLGGVVESDIDFQNITFAVTYQYEKCEHEVSLWKEAPHFLSVFVSLYAEVRQWWLFGFYFCLPVFFSLLFALLVARRLTNVHDKCVNEYGQYIAGDGGTMNSHKGGSLNRSNSFASNQTASSEAQNLMAAEGRTLGSPHNDHARNHVPTNRNASPVSPYPPMMTPMLVRASNNPMSPTSDGAPAYNGSALSSPSMNSVPYDGNAVTSAGKSSSLPPHGRGARGRTRMQKIIFHNVARDRAMNTLLVALILAFSLAWLPQHIFGILFSKTQVDEALSAHFVTLIKDICRYFSALAFAVNPIVIYLSYKAYRVFLDKFCCRCCCCQ